MYCRHHSVGETFVRRRTRHVAPVVGYDANSLYLHAICQEMPVGRYVRRAESRGFEADSYAKCRYAMFDWMDWLNECRGLDIRHKMNSGGEFRVGPYFVDGHDGNKLYEFMGCYWHGCPCKKWQDEELRATRHRRTLDRLAFIRGRGFEVTVIWECDYRLLLKDDPEMKLFVTVPVTPFTNEVPFKVTAEQILESVVDDTLFGAVEVDLEVPDSWDDVDHKSEPLRILSGNVPDFLYVADTV